MVDEESEHNFQGTLEQWDDRVFQNAAVFRIHRFNKENKRDEFETPSFKVAMVAAHSEIKAGYRVLVYAVDESGRFICLPQDRWNHYAELWLKKKR
jgi:hypothetical protein